VYLARGDEPIIDLVKGGQAVFGLALGQVATDTPATLTPPPRRHPQLHTRHATGRTTLRIVS
jgi:hypothetical protein